MLKMHFGFGSGEEIVAGSVRLAPKSMLQNAAAMKAEAQEKIGAAPGSGAGFWGGPVWAIEASMVLNAIERAMSASRQKEGVQQYIQSLQLLEEAKSLSRFIPVSAVHNAGVPSPMSWIASGKGIIKRLNPATMTAIDKHWLRNSETETDPSGIINIIGDTEYAYDGGEFIHVETDRGVEMLRWAAVANYRIS